MNSNDIWYYSPRKGLPDKMYYGSNECYGKFTFGRWHEIRSQGHSASKTTSMIRFFFPTIALILLAVSLPGCSRKKEPQPDVILLHSGRMRGNVYPLSLQNIAPLQHYQYLAGYIRAVRAEAEKSGARVFVMDLGDSLGGSFASHVTDSMNMVTFFNNAGYDAVMLSNLDADVPAESISQIRAKVLNPFVGPDGTPTLPGTAAGARLEKGGLQIDVLANFYGDTDPKQNPGRFPAKFGSVSEGVRPVRDYASVLTSLGSRPPGALTLLAWMKFESTDTPPEGFLEFLRKERVDAILAHRTYGANQREAWQASGFVDWKPPVSANILRNNGGFVLARLDLARDGAGWKVLRHELVPMTANNATADPLVVAGSDKFADPISRADAVVACLPSPLSESQILRVYMSALAKVPGTQAVVYSPESIRSDWPAGDLRASRVFNSLPWTSGLVQLTLTVADIQQLPALSGIHVFLQPGLGDGPVVVTTSQFFASLICGKLRLPATAVTSLPQTSEFDFFADYLKSQNGALPSQPPEGWEVLTP